MSSFGKEFEIIWPKSDFKKILTEYGRGLLQNCSQVIKPPVDSTINIEEFIKKSSEFPLKFPIETCRVKSQHVERYVNIKQQIASAYPVIHEKVVFLIIDFLEYKLRYGSSLEKHLYANMSITDFVQRLLVKRCVSFVGPFDFCKLLTGKMGTANTYPNIGTELEEEPFILRDCISYDEIKISSFLSVSSNSELLNDGKRSNKGIIETDLSKIEREGVIVGIIGARFQKPLHMEYQDILITADQNVRENGYGYENESGFFRKKVMDDPKLKSSIEYRKLWQKFYESKDVLYENMPQNSKRFTQIRDKAFDNVMMKKRYAISFDTLLLESQARAVRVGKQAYVHVVGIGLGAWEVASHQKQIFLECFYQRIEHLLPHLNNVGVLHFSWFDMTEWGKLKHNGFIKSKSHLTGGIKTFMANRSPAATLKGTEYENMQLVISYAWDPNALPGNEFWYGHLADSNDPSNACSTLVTEIHNPHINSEYVNGKNLHVASGKYGVLHISDYVKKILKDL